MPSPIDGKGTSCPLTAGYTYVYMSPRKKSACANAKRSHGQGALGRFRRTPTTMATADEPESELMTTAEPWNGGTNR